jgi:hypothetical protein
MAEASPAAAAAHTSKLTEADAAAAVAEDASFDPTAWEMAAAAAAHAAASEITVTTVNTAKSASQHRDQQHVTSAICWAVDLLSQAMTAAAAAAESTTAGSVSLQQLLLLPSSKAAAQLLQLRPSERAGLLLLLCGGEGGSRGDFWLGNVLVDVQHRLGLLEMGVLLAAVYHR